jgi:hypothetical protein
MNTRAAGLVATVIGLCGWISAAVADEPKLEEIDLSGKPKDYKAGATTRYAIWHEDGTWHFRYTTGNEDLQSMTGTITVVGGRMSTIVRRGTPAKGVKTGADATVETTTAPSYKFNAKINQGIEGGIDFTLDDKATALKFELKINSKEVPSKVFVGSKGAHPKSDTFYLPAHPKK